MARWARIVVGAYVAACALSLAFVVASKLALFGLKPDGMAGIWTVVLALPWSLWVLPMVHGGPTASGVVVMAMMVLNAAILAGLGVLPRRRRAA